MDDESDVLRGLVLQRLLARRNAARLADRLAAARSAPLPRKRCKRWKDWLLLTATSLESFCLVAAAQSSLRASRGLEPEAEAW